MRTIGMIALALLVAVAILAIGHQQESCEVKGGTMVRGVFWFQCVKSNP